MIVVLSLLAFIVLHLIHGVIFGMIRDGESCFTREFWT